MITVFEWLDQRSLDLHYSLEVSGFKGVSVLLNDDGNLPKGFTSPYAFFCQIKDGQTKPVYFNQIKVPDFWQITGNNGEGDIWNNSDQKAKIYYHDPKHLRLVKHIDWLNPNGKVYLTDHYNQFGWVFARTYFDAEQKISHKKYFNQQGQEIISENQMTGDILLQWKNQTHHFANRTDFFLYYFKQANFDQETIWYNSLSTPFALSYYLGGNGKDILFWQEEIGDQIPGNMQMILERKASRTQGIVVQNKTSFDKLTALLSQEQKQMVSYLGYISPDYRSNQNRKEILILTNSDNIEGLTVLVQELKDYHFHIATLTEMSPKLMAFGDSASVFLYPNIAPKMATKLFEKCDIYLDINHGSEILSATRQAFESNLVIAAFNNTLHATQFVLKEAIFTPQDHMGMVNWIKDQDDLKQTSLKQRKEAGQESPERYQMLF
ncbi:accessory Sec system glycosylation chaperone GtfB [Streptococcus iniae]|uniref:accessory Sec system glycosylation chaperone GtfB n=1 Tax=Streptococcus iniae TaxID=1346 RepID=UPI002B2D034D|nr:accessory Sec system glycosylation chaperone GtfB [Streptococcus iniae]WNZ97550.1 accessory Sec system glycosylation chaperone GtfB [Streptococcus iniae]